MPASMWLNHRYREQARSHIGSSEATNFMYTAAPCGSGLARDEAGISNIFIDCDTAFASRLAPTLDLQQTQTPCAPGPPVGASLLAMRPVHPTSSSTVTPPSRAGSLPHWVFRSHKLYVHRSPLVGAGLPAKRPAHPTSSSTVTPPSRAGSLPHWIFSRHKLHVHLAPLWERACSR